MIITPSNPIWIDKQVEIHHDKHHTGYTMKFNATLEKQPLLFLLDVAGFPSGLIKYL